MMSYEKRTNINATVEYLRFKSLDIFGVSARKTRVASFDFTIAPLFFGTPPKYKINTYSPDFENFLSFPIPVNIKIM